MENRGILKWRTWSIVHKAQVVGALIGVLSTIGEPLLNALPWIEAEPHRSPINIFTVTGMLVFYPTSLVCDAFGWRPFLYTGNEGPSLIVLSVAVVINCLLCMVIGTFVGFLLQRRKNRK